MRALVMSDSHGWTNEVQEIVQRHEQEVDIIFHCGDSELKKDSLTAETVNTVRGNCDFDESFPNELTKDVNGVRFFVTHGHLQNVKMNEMILLYRGLELGAHIVCFGHTHIPTAIQKDDIILVNPGSMRLPRHGTIGTYAIIKKVENQIEVIYYTMDGQLEKNLSKIFLINC
ncbi:metallophosphoesterase [Evansella sp. AB-P1]|uniref:metallophosphoesterase family protein n=1 Tax=Evansella sp. AB-P1 TaxID=3037653 RepID=UPI00241C7B26|nr:metallophosphoesterase [Evansella sp. AB-P1]MDG5786901.1 metallophosphoesterase [Evansella sp. AB-P1]